MALRQDDTEPTGVSSDGNRTYLVPAIERKEDAALGLILSRPRMSWSEVAEALGYSSPRAAKVAFENAWQRRVKNDDRTREKLRGWANGQMDMLISAAMAKALDPSHPEQLAAMGRVREIIADQRKLFGLDAPTEVNVHTNPSQQEIENWVAKMKGTTKVEESDIFADLDIEDAEIVEEPVAIEAPIEEDDDWDF